MIIRHTIPERVGDKMSLKSHTLGYTKASSKLVKIYVLEDGDHGLPFLVLFFNLFGSKSPS